MKRPGLGLLTVILSGAAMLTPVPARAAGDGLPGFAGSWTAVDCATWFEDRQVDCDVWGDGSQMTLHVGSGDTPRVTFADAYAISCATSGSRSTRWVGEGIGYYYEIWLFVPLDKTGCGTYQQNSGIELQFWWDPSTDTLWEDENGDGWGYLWHRSVSAPGLTTGYSGLWVATDQDGSALTMRIGIGESPQVTFQDAYASSCDYAGSPSTRWVGEGIGYYYEIWLFVPLDKTGCGTYQQNSGIELQFYWDPGSDSLWEDEDGDGVGITWSRAR